MDVRLEDHGDWFVLEGGRNWASVEGEAQEWRAIAAGIRSRTPTGFKRCAVEFRGDGAVFDSPRNSRGIVDEIRVPNAYLSTLADQIDATVGLPIPDVAIVDSVTFDAGEG